MSSSRKQQLTTWTETQESAKLPTTPEVRGWTWQDSYLVSALVSSFPGEVGKDLEGDSLIKELDNSRG